jgi:hypothetical protein
MAHALKHAQSSARKFGGRAEDYLPIHNWFDESKAFLADFRHRALRHHAEGIFLAEKLFGIAIVNSDGIQVPVRYVGEQHVTEDLGRIPTAQDRLLQIKPQRWCTASAWMKKQRQPRRSPNEHPKRSCTERPCPRIRSAACDAGLWSPSGSRGTDQRTGGGTGSAV